MMPRTRLFIRSLLALLLVGACFAAMIAPLLGPAQAAPEGAGNLASAPPGALIISSFRFQGPTDPGDEYVEIFNRSCSTTPWDLSGYVLASSAGSTKGQIIYTFPAGTTLSAGQYYLVGGPTYSGTGSTAPDNTTPYSPAINSTDGGVGLFATNNTNSPAVDAVGYSIDGYVEGTTALTPLTTGTESYVRKTSTSGMYVDTNNNSADFVVQNPSAPHNSQSTPGTCGTPVPATPTKTPIGFNPPVIINEVAWYGTIGATQNDWIELYNTTAGPIDLTGWTLDALTSGVNIELNGTIKAHGYYLLAHDSSGTSVFATSTPTAAATPVCHVFATDDGVRIDQYFTGVLATYNEILFLTAPNGATVDTANRNGGYWPAGSYTNSASMERHGINPDSDTAWFTYAAATDPNPVHNCSGYRVYGTPGRRNWAASVTATPSPVPTKYKTATPRPPTPFGHVVINEFLPRAGYDWNQDGTVDVYDEFIEIKNLGPVAAQLTGWKLDVISPGGPSSYSISGVTLQPGDRALFYGLKSHISLYDSGGTIRLINNRSVIVDARSYGPVQSPDQSTCRIPDGYYWRFPCFPTPGLENSLTGTLPVPPPVIASQPPPCLLGDTVPDPFKQAECYGYGADVFNPAYWDDQSGFNSFPVPDVIDKNRSVVR